MVTLGAVKSITTYTGNEAEEKALNTYNYNYDGNQIKTVTGFTYALDALTLSVTNKASNITANIADVTLGAKKSETTYTGNEAEEKAQKTYNYNFDGSQIKTVTEFFYTNDALSSSNTNRVANVTGDRSLVVLGAMKSITEYTGNEGEEKALKTYNYNFAGDQIKTITSFTYTNDALTLSTTNRAANITGDTAMVTLGAVKSITTYTGKEAEEKAQNT